MCIRDRVWSGTSRASDLSLGDRIKLLYSNQFHFNDRGEPQITIGIVQHVERVTISAARGLLVLPSGAGGTTIEGGTSFDVTLHSGHAAQRQFSDWTMGFFDLNAPAGDLPAGYTEFLDTPLRGEAFLPAPQRCMDLMHIFRQMS